MNDIITLAHVNKELGKRQILKDVTLVVKQGDIFRLPGSEWSWEDNHYPYHPRIAGGNFR